MPEPDRIQRDKATILAIIKYTMFALIAAAVVYLGFRLIWIMLPFLIGFILAKLAGRLASIWLDLIYRIKRRQQRKTGGYKPETESAAVANPAESSAGQPAEAATLTDPTLSAARRKRGHYPHGLATSRHEIRVAVVFYVLEVIALIALIIGVILGAISQLRSLAIYLPGLIKNSDLSQRLVDYLNDLSSRLGGVLQADFLQFVEEGLADLQQKLLQAMPGIASTILNSIGSFAGFLPILLFIIIVVIMSGYYFITDSRSMFVFLKRNITSKIFREKSVRLVNSLSTTLFRVIGGYLLLLIVTFIEALTGLLILGMPYAVIISLVASVVDFLPILGISATLIPVSIYFFVNGNIFGGLGALVLLAIMSMVRRIIEPAILGNAMSLHPMATLASMIIGIALYGLTGIIVGPILLVIAKEIMNLYGFDKKIRSIVGDVLNKLSS